MLEDVAEFERAKARGVKMGRKPKLTDHEKREALRRRNHGEETLAEIWPQPFIRP